MNARFIFARAFLLLAPLGMSNAHAAPQGGCVAVSGPQRAALVELYTSEGCSSCPPADKQLSLIGAPGNTNVVALALHVNFWDYIGWKDPFARAEFTERQRWLIGVNGSRTLYTPHFFVSGKEVQNRAQVGAVINASSQKPAGANIRLEADHRANGELVVRIHAAGSTATDPVNLHAAVTESGLSTRVSAGENSGATLPHDHVVRHWFAPVSLQSGVAHLTQSVSLSPGQAKKGVSVVAFVQNARTGEVLQAVTSGSCRGV